MKHLVALSGGKDSTAMALRLAEVEPRDYTYFITPTGDELPDLLAHWDRLAVLLGKPLFRIPCPTLKDTIATMQMLPNWRARFCTRLIKIQPAREWVAAQGETTMYVGLRADEGERVGMLEAPESATMRFPLREWGWGLAEVRGYLAERGVTIPARTDCARCFFQRLSEWRDLWLNHPDIYEDAVQDEARLGHTYRSPGRDTWPAGLAALREEFKRGRPMRRSRREMEACHACRA